MARRIPLHAYGTNPDDLKASLDAKIAAKEMSEADASRQFLNERRANPWFDYAAELVELVSAPAPGRGNSGAEVRTINKIVAVIENAAQTKAQSFVLEESEYAFLAGRVAMFSSWANFSPALNRLIEQFLDHIANAETVDLNKKPDLKVAQ